MNMHNPNVGPLKNTLQGPIPAQEKKHYFCELSNVLMSTHSVNIEAFSCQQWDNSKADCEFLKHAYKLLRVLKRQEAMKWGKWTKSGYNDGVEKQKGPFLFNQAPSELTNSFSSPSSLAHLHLFYVPASYYAGVYAKKVVRFAKWVAPFPHTF